MNVTPRNAFLFTFLLIGVVTWLGCKSEPQSSRQAPERMELSSEVTLDFDALTDGERDTPAPEAPGAGEARGGAGLDDLLLLVSDASAMNFTYSKEVGQGLAAARVELEGTKKLRRKAIEGFLEDLLAAYGFEIRNVGPESIRVWQVRPLGADAQDAGFEAIALENVRVAEAADACQGIAVAGPFTLVPDEQTNTLLVYAGNDDLSRIQEAVERLDADSASDPR